jgi:hypothetical protein
MVRRRSTEASAKFSVLDVKKQVTDAPPLHRSQDRRRPVSFTAALAATIRMSL